MKEGLEDLKEASEKLFKLRIQKSKASKSQKWTHKELNKVLKELKLNKSRDPLGLANKIFKPEVAGSDLKDALLLLMNTIKEQQKYP